MGLEVKDYGNTSGLDREALEDLYQSRVWDTQELQEEFEVTGFMAPFVTVRSRMTGKSGTLEFQHRPRFYHSFREDK